MAYVQVHAYKAWIYPLRGRARDQKARVLLMMPDSAYPARHNLHNENVMTVQIARRLAKAILKAAEQAETFKQPTNRVKR